VSRLHRHLSPDDWGMSPSINDACLELAYANLTHTISVCVKRPFFRHRLDELIRLQKPGKTQVALHLDLDFPERCAWHSLWWRTGNLEEEIEKQRSLFLESGLSLDSVNGHRHVHLYPGPLSVVSEWGLPLRLASDPSHWRSYVSGQVVRILKKAQWRKSGYLRPRDLTDIESLERKAGSFPELLCHPASRDDFSQIAFPDPLRSERVDEFNGIIRILASAHE
jgi:predicted glycoside hydrolase/deacetylase ChbG (UPF0249 family)